MNLPGVDDLADVEDLRLVIAAALRARPLDDQSLRRGVWAYVCAARQLGMAPGDVIMTLTLLVEGSSTGARTDRDAITRRVILWCVDAYFGQLGERVGEGVSVRAPAPSVETLPPVRASNR